MLSDIVYSIKCTNTIRKNTKQRNERTIKYFSMYQTFKLIYNLTKHGINVKVVQYPANMTSLGNVQIVMSQMLGTNINDVIKNALKLRDGSNELMFMYGFILSGNIYKSILTKNMFVARMLYINKKYDKEVKKC